MQEKVPAYGGNDGGKIKTAIQKKKKNVELIEAE